METFDESVLKIPTRSNIIITGSSGSGKSTLAMKLIKYEKEMFTENHNSIRYHYGIYSDTIRECDQLGIPTFLGLPDLESLKTAERPLLLIIDDLMQEMTKNEELVNNLFVRQSHHMNITVIILVQSLFRVPVAARQSAHIFFFCSDISSVGSVRQIGSQLFGGTEYYKLLLDAMNDIRKEKFGYLFVNLSPRSDSRFRFLTKIFPEDTPVVFMP